MSKHQPIVGLHLGLHYEMGHRLLRGVLDYANEHPAISLADFCFKEDSPVPPGDPPWKEKVDGMVVGVSYDRRILSWIKHGGVPTVNAGSDLMDTPIVSVFSSPESLARRAVEHLHGIGYRNFVYVGSQVGWLAPPPRGTFRGIERTRLQTARGRQLVG